MKLNKIKLISALFIGLNFLGLSTFASAKDLKISNDSKYDLSFSINNICSEQFGIVENHSVKVISEANFKKACAYDPNQCEVQVYNAASCAGKKVAAVVFDANNGVIGLYSMEIITKANGFNLFFEGPWAK